MVLRRGNAINFFRRARPRHGRITPSTKKISQYPGHPRIRTLSACTAQVSMVCKHEARHIAIIEAHYSEVRLDPLRETHGHGQGSGLSGEAESRVAGFRFAPVCRGHLIRTCSLV